MKWLVPTESNREKQVQQKLLKENKDWLLTIYSYPQPIYINLFSLCPAIPRRSSLANQIILSAKFSEIYFIGGICKKPHEARAMMKETLDSAGRQENKEKLQAQLDAYIEANPQ